MKVTINNQPIQKNGWFDFSDFNFGDINPFTHDWIKEPAKHMAEGGFWQSLAQTIIEQVKPIIHVINMNSAEIITLGVIICAGGLMFLGNKHKWYGRLTYTFLIGCVWRVLLTCLT